MAKPARRELRQLEENGFRGRSETYRYIRRYLPHFEKIGVGTPEGPSWAQVAAHLNRVGMRNASGGVISRDSALKMFQRARRDDVAARAARAAQPPAVAPVRPKPLPRDWVPPALLAAPSASTALAVRPTHAAPSTPPGQRPPDPADWHPDIDRSDPFSRIQFVFDVQSGRRNPITGDKV